MKRQVGWLTVLAVAVAGPVLAQAEETAPPGVIALAEKVVQSIQARNVMALSGDVSLDGIGPLANTFVQFQNMGENERQMLASFMLLFNPPGGTLTLGEPVQRDGTLTYPVRHQYNSTLLLLMKPVGNRYMLDLLGSGMASLGLPPDITNAARKRTPEEVAGAFTGFVQQGPLPLVATEFRGLEHLFTAESQRALTMVAEFGDAGVLFRPMMELVLATMIQPEATKELGQPVRRGEHWVVPMTTNLDLQQQLVLVEENGGWRVDLVNSARATLGMALQSAGDATYRVAANELQQLHQQAEAQATEQQGALPDVAWATAAVGRVGSRYAYNAALSGAAVRWQAVEPDTVLFFEVADPKPVAGPEAVPAAGRHDGQVAVVTVGGEVDRLAPEALRQRLATPVGGALSIARGRIHTVGQAILKYAEGQGGRLPAADGWADMILPLVGGDRSQFQLPEAVGEGALAFNSTLGAVPLRAVARPETTVLLFETDEGEWSTDGGAELVSDRGIHGGKVFCMMVSGQVRLVAPDELRRLLGGLF